jgi:hypothetical protein
MIKIKIKSRPANSKLLLAIALTLLFQLTSFAQVPGEFEGTDPPAAPIDDYVWFLMIIGIVFSFYKFKEISRQNKSNNFL